MQQISRLLMSFRKNERGAMVVDHIPVFFAVTIIVLVIIEIALAHFLLLRAQKAAAVGARMAITLPPAIADVPTINEPITPNGGLRVPCFSNVGPANCVDPGGPWTCTGDACSNLGGLVMDRIVSEIQRIDFRVTSDAVTLTYTNRQLGNANGPFMPEISVRLAPQAYEFTLIQLGPSQEQADPHPFMVNFVGDTVANDPTVYDGVVASAFGEGLDIDPLNPGINP
ncbi:MAG: TadE/TadG family type IV pilus assembly protein [Paracoccaceae bacterium]